MSGSTVSGTTVGLPTPCRACFRPGLRSVVAGAVILSLFVGSDFFPQVDAGLIQLHVRAPARTRVERTEQISGRSKTISVN
jgi:multidrug efflux pump subunit AcrB